MAVHSPLNAFSFDISLIEFGQEIKLLEHFKKSLDHPVYIFLRIQTVGGFRSIFEKYNELFHCNDVFFHAGCETDKRQNTNLI
jgi:hypothetical protein